MNGVLNPRIFVGIINEPFVFLKFPIGASVNHDKTLYLSVTSFRLTWFYQNTLKIFT